MDALFDGSLGTGTLLLLVLSLLIAFGFEFVNGFHDTANAVATVIYTRSLRPWTAVILSGVCNFLGVFIGGIAVALSIINLLPLELLVAGGTGAGLAMLLALLLAAITWNLGTWYFGLPSSSSHTLIGAIVGVGLANSTLPGHEFGVGVNWAKAGDVGLALLISPLVGFTLAALLLLAAKKLIRDPQLYRPPVGTRPPPAWIRTVLIGTCTGVSFAHGSNDGQKGVGLVMLILMGIVPAGFALNLELSQPELQRAARAVDAIEQSLEVMPAGVDDQTMVMVRTELAELDEILKGATSLRDVPAAERWLVRRDVLLIDGTVKKLEASVEKPLAAELVAMSTIGISAGLGLPVSTTHVLSSGVAGTMVAQRSGLQMQTITKIASAWLLTLPVSMLLAGLLFLMLRAVLV